MYNWINNKLRSLFYTQNSNTKITNRGDHHNRCPAITFFLQLGDMKRLKLSRFRVENKWMSPPISQRWMAAFENHFIKSNAQKSDLTGFVLLANHSTATRADFACVHAYAFVSRTKHSSFGSLRLFSFVTWIIDLKNLHIDRISETPINPNSSYLRHIKTIRINCLIHHIQNGKWKSYKTHKKNMNRADGR